jgi:hypothetical protein
MSSNTFAALAAPEEESPVAQLAVPESAVPESAGEGKWQRSPADLKKYQNPHFLTGVQRIIAEITDMSGTTGYFKPDGSIERKFDQVNHRIWGPQVPERKFVGGRWVETGNFIDPFYQTTYPTGFEIMPGTRLTKSELSEHPQVPGLLIRTFKDMFGPEVYVGVRITPEQISVRLMKDKRLQ